MSKKPNCKCESCKKDFYKKPCNIKKSKRHFCCLKCFSENSKEGEVHSCANCGKDVYRKKSQVERSLSGNVFCSKKCSTTINNSIYKSGKDSPNRRDDSPSTYRKRALEDHGESCNNDDCPFNEVPVKMLDVHHIDSDRSNNHISNLEVLCVWCHVLKTRGS